MNYALTASPPASMLASMENKQVLKIEVDVGVTRATRIAGVAEDGAVVFDTRLSGRSWPIEEQVRYLVSQMKYFDINYGDLILDTTGVGMPFNQELERWADTGK